MQVFLFLLLVTAALAGTINESEKDYEKEFHKAYPNKDVEKEHSHELETSEAEINKDNADYASGKSTFSEKLTSLSDMTTDEIKEEKEGAKVPPKMSFDLRRPSGIIMPPEELRNNPENQRKLDELYAEVDRANIPASFDARKLKKTTPARNQMSCGSCSAFSATGLFETCMIGAGAKNNKQLDLSEQFTLDCAYDGDGANGCGGAYVHIYQEWLAKNGGQVPHENTYKYKDTEPAKKCPKGKEATTWNSGAKITDAIFDYGCTEEKLKKLVATHGAVSVAMYASARSFGNLNKGIFQGCPKNPNIDHAVLAVGYGTEKGVDYWIVKNSWGDSWGDKGFFRIRRGTNECSIGNICVVTKCSKSGKQDKAPVAPTPPPVPAKLECDLSQYFGPDLEGNISINFGKGYKDVTCASSKCRPRVAGPSNGCMYLCGQLKC